MSAAAAMIIPASDSRFVNFFIAPLYQTDGLKSIEFTMAYCAPDGVDVVSMSLMVDGVNDNVWGKDSK